MAFKKESQNKKENIVISNHHQHPSIIYMNPLLTKHFFVTFLVVTELRTVRCCADLGSKISSFTSWDGVYMDVSKNNGTPKWMVKIMENPIKIHDLGVFPYSWKHPYLPGNSANVTFLGWWNRYVTLLNGCVYPTIGDEVWSRIESMVYDSICILVVYMYTWSHYDLYFWRSIPQNKPFSNQNKGHLGSRCVCVCVYIYIYMIIAYCIISKIGLKYIYIYNINMTQTIDVFLEPLVVSQILTMFSDHLNWSTSLCPLTVPYWGHLVSAWHLRSNLGGSFPMRETRDQSIPKLTND